MSADPLAAANVTRSALGLSPDRPIFHLIHAIERCGGIVFAIPTVLERRDAFCTWVGQDAPRPVVIVASARSGDRLRFSVAHELGHVVMHQPPQGDDREIERQADRFAAELLMPEAAMHHELVQPVTLTTLAPLKPRWGVAIQALIRRAHELNVISSSQYWYLNERLSARGWKLEEPKNLEIAIERPRALRQMAELLYGRPIDYKKMADEMHLAPTFLKQIVEAHAEKRRPASQEATGKPSQGGNVLPMRPNLRA